MILRQNTQNSNTELQKAQSIPPYINKGGKSLEHQQNTNSDQTKTEINFTSIIDYLSFTFKPLKYADNRYKNSMSRDAPDYSEHSHFYELRGVLNYFKNNIIQGLTFKKSDKGYAGYTYTFKLFRYDQPCGLAAWGGNNGTVLISFTGQACAQVDMHQVHELLVAFEAKITRVDLAHDDLMGGKTINEWKSIAESGEFASSGRPPDHRFVVNSEKTKGDTVYVGKKANGKEACIYEKGKQLGDGFSNWVRIEGRLYAVDRSIPYDVLLEPSKYLAGMYPPFRFLSSVYETIKIVKEKALITSASLVRNAKRSYGKLINYLSQIGLTSAEICDILVNDKGIPTRLSGIPSSDLYGVDAKLYEVSL